MLNLWKVNFCCLSLPVLPILPAAKHRYFAGAGGKRIYRQNGMYSVDHNNSCCPHIVVVRIQPNLICVLGSLRAVQPLESSGITRPQVSQLVVMEKKSNRIPTVTST